MGVRRSVDGGPRVERLPRSVVAPLRDATAVLVGDRVRLEARADEVRRVLGMADRSLVADVWNEERVLPLAVARAAELGLVDADWSSYAGEAREQALAAAAVLELVARQVTRALAKDGIPSVVLKGAPLATQVHGDPALRQRSDDVDLLVASGHLATASGVLQRLGWQAPEDHRLAGGLPPHHLTHQAAGAAPKIELHWRVHWFDDGSHAAATLARAVDQEGLPVPHPLDTLDALLLIYARDGFHRLRLPADVAAWWSRFGPEHGAAARARIDGAARAVASRGAAGSSVVAGPSGAAGSSVVAGPSGVLDRPIALAAQAAAAVVGTPAPAVDLTDRWARLALRLAAQDRPRPEVRAFCQEALLDLAAAPAARRRERWNETWFRDPGIVRDRNPWAPRAAVPLLRGATATRKLATAAALLTRP